MIFISTFLKKFSNQANFLLSKYIGQKMPFYYVCEFPRSGGTWIANMLSDYLQLPFPKQSIFPLGHSCIIHNHWNYSERLKNPIYVIRDGRDAAVSMMFFASKGIKSNLLQKKYFKKRYPSLLRYPIDKYGNKECFKHFIYDWMSHGVGTKFDWKRHLQQWIYSPDVILVKYEDFQLDCRNTLISILSKLGFDDIDGEMIDWTIEKFSFYRQTGRKPGDNDIMNDIRKGIIGDWKNYFDNSTANEFDKYAGNFLIELGYEKNHSWINEI